MLWLFSLSFLFLWGLARTAWVDMGTRARKGRRVLPAWSASSAVVFQHSSSSHVSGWTPGCTGWEGEPPRALSVSVEVGFRDPAGTGRRWLGYQAGWEGQAYSWGRLGLRKRANR